MSRRAPLAAAVALALAGCGSSPLSTGALRTRAARICRLADVRASRIRTPTLPAQGITFLSQGIAVLQPELKALSRLRPGGPADHLFVTALSAFERQLKMVKATADNVRHGGDPVIAVKTLQTQLAPVQSQGDAAWESLEIPGCVAH